MNLIFRCDSSTEMGSGHVIRCLALAEHFKALRHTVHFACIALPGNLIELIQKSGFTVFSAHPEQKSLDWLPPTPHHYDWAVIDHYEIQAEQEIRFKEIANRVLVIDDWGTRAHAADLIIDPSISSASNHRRIANPNIEFRSGGDWTLLRNDFLTNHDQTSPRQEFKTILVFFGGTDPADQIMPYYEAIKILNPPQLKFIFLVTQQHQRIEKFKKIERTDSLEFLISPASISDLLKKVDFYLGSSGTISWERMCLGITGAVISIVENQEDVAKTLADQKLHFYLGRHDETEPKKMILSVLELLKNETLLQEMSKRCYEAIDGKGCSRVSTLMEQLALTWSGT